MVVLRVYSLEQFGENHSFWFVEVVEDVGGFSALSMGDFGGEGGAGIGEFEEYCSSVLGVGSSFDPPRGFERIHNVRCGAGNDAQLFGEKPQSDRFVYSGEHSQSTTLGRGEAKWFEGRDLAPPNGSRHGQHDIGEFALSGMHGVSLALLVSAS